jgi:hypothetical protein
MAHLDRYTFLHLIQLDSYIPVWSRGGLLIVVNTIHGPPSSSSTICSGGWQERRPIRASTGEKHVVVQCPSKISSRMYIAFLKWGLMSTANLSSQIKTLLKQDGGSLSFYNGIHPIHVNLSWSCCFPQY